MKKLSTSDFMKKVKAVWGDKFTYSNLVYINSRTKVVVTCPTHGDFSVSPSNLIYGKSGCPTCGGQHGKSTEQFVKDAKVLHGELYDYSKVEYVSATKPIIIICPTHGEFLQKPTVHLKNCGCPRCAKVAKLNTSEFITKSILVHGVRYDYSNTTYTKATDMVKMKCPIHGDFVQLPHNHLAGRGCPKCGVESFKSKMTMSESEALEICASKQIKLVSYSGNGTQSSTVECSKGHKWTTPVSKIQQGSGCPVCAISGYNPLKQGYVYLLMSECKQFIKVGLSNHPKKRIKTLKNLTPFEFSVVGWKKMSGKLAPKIETEFHKKLVSANFKGFDGCTEWFRYDADVKRHFSD